MKHFRGIKLPGGTKSGNKHLAQDGWFSRSAVRSGIARTTGLVFSKPSLLVTALVIIVVSLLEWNSTTAVIDDFEISPTLAKDGVTPSMVSHALDSKLRDIQAVANTDMALRSLSVDKPPQFVIPGTGISLNFLIGQLKSVLPVSQWRVGGAILTLKNQMQTVIRIDVSDEHKVYDDSYDTAAAATCVSNQNVDPASEKDGWPELSAQLSCAAEFILRHTQPYILAVYYKETGNSRAAKELLLSMLYHPPHTDDHWSLNLLGSIAYDEAQKTNDPQTREKQMAEANDYYQKSEDAYKALQRMRSMPPFVLAYVNRGILYASQKKYDLAKQSYQRALSEDPSYGLAYSNLAGMQAAQAAAATDATTKLRLLNEAFGNYQKGSDVTVNLQQKAIVLTSWARSLFDAAKYPEALQKVDSAVAADSAYADAYFMKGRILDKTKKPDDNSRGTLDAYAAAEKLNPWNSTFAIEYAKALQRYDQLEESVTEFAKIVKRLPPNANVILEYAETLADTIREQPARYPLALEQFYQAYDLTSKADPKAEPSADIEDKIRAFVQLYLKLGRQTTKSADAETEQATLLDAGDKFLRGGYVFANSFYLEAIQLTPGKPTDDLKKTIIEKLVKAAADAPEAKRSALIDLAWQYDPSDGKLLIRKFMTLILADRSVEAKSFASKYCVGSKDFEEVAKRQLGDWTCPD